MRQDNTSTLSGLASFAKLQGLLTARRQEGCAEAEMTFEAFEVERGHAVRDLENAHSNRFSGSPRGLGCGEPLAP